MPDINENERRKQNRAALKSKAETAFEESLPMSRTLFMALFDYLDIKLGSEACDSSFKKTEYFLTSNDVPNISTVKDWLADKGGYCDCEVLANVEELFNNGSK